ncbi:rhomboid family intramembrane serine protease [Curtobacterium sp. VKM Ac-2922]|uniref:rhomboid family intramembrane serine protease n=1 Tax=Curtobacterium sp. VKM Ac-2922 TaxID=2929475 RepID=UPI001FB293C1|nr:rhomboid family intramembrane serine protease [Curtobacterium sp. VKM Ac-2922]MCJ1715122.1 rhomboid family intramembrane serine protease [Curtobacterium sp. VKM Ac-2922]
MTATPPRQRGHLRFPVTVVVLVVTATVSVVGLVDPQLGAMLTRDGVLVRDGQWWRLVTPMLVQPDGWGQFAFNLLGIVIVGAALEQRRPARLWLATYLTASVGIVVLLTLIRPGDHDGGSSHGVAALIGALAVTTVLDGRRHAVPSPLLDVASIAYSAFFCVYLAMLDLGGPWPAIVAGDLAVALSLTAWRLVGTTQTWRGVLVVLVLAGIAMAVRLDGHGIGLLAGAVVATVGRPRRSR